MLEPSSYGTAAPGHASRGFSTGLATTAAATPPDPNAGDSVAATSPSGPPQCVPSPKRQRLQGLATGGPGTGTRLAAQGQQGTQAVTVPEQPAPVISVPWGHGGCGGSGGVLPAADLYGHPYSGAPLRPVDVNQRPRIANQQGTPARVAGVQGSAGLGDEDGLRLRRDSRHPGHLLAATGTAAGYAADGMAAGSGACGSVAAAAAPVRGYYDGPVGGAGADLEGASPHAFTPDPAQASSPLGPLAEGMGYRQPGAGGDVAGAEGPSGGLWSRGGEGGASGGGQPPAARGVVGTCSGGGRSEAAGIAAPDAQPGDAGVGVAMRAVLRKYQICLRKHVAAVLWPGLAEQIPAHQPQQVLLHTARTPAAAQRGQKKSRGQQQEEELRVYPMTLVRYGTTDFRLTGVMAAVKALGVRDKEAVGLRQLPCGRVLLERWRQQGQGHEGKDVQRASAKGKEVPSGDADEGSDEEYVPYPKRRRLQRPARGGSGTAASGREAAGPVTNITTTSCPVRLHAAAAEADAHAWHVRIARTSLLPPAAVTWQLWPQQAAALKENLYPDHTVPVTLLTSACNRTPPAAAAAAAERSACTQQVGEEQWPAEQHTVLLHYTAASAKFRVKGAAGVTAALGLQDGDMLRLRRSPDGRAWAERALPSAALQQPHPALAASASPPAAGTAEWVLPPAAHSALQQPAPALTPPAAGTAAAVPNPSTAPPALQQPGPGLAAASTAPAAAAPATDANTPLASQASPPALSPDAPHPLLCFPAAPTATATTGPLCVSGGYLHPATPTVAALWPECVNIPVSNHQLVRMRAVVEPGGGGIIAAAAAAATGPNASHRRSVTHLGDALRGSPGAAGAGGMASGAHARTAA